MPSEQDTKDQAASCLEAAARIGVYFRKNQDRISMLLLQYSDAEAAEMLGLLREEFWSAR